MSAYDRLAQKVDDGTDAKMLLEAIDFGTVQRIAECNGSAPSLRGLANRILEAGAELQTYLDGYKAKISELEQEAQDENRREAEKLIRDDERDQ